jgi:hypothetical protein
MGNAVQMVVNVRLVRRLNGLHAAISEYIELPLHLG